MQPHVQLVPLPDSGDADSELIRVLPITSPQACLRNLRKSISLGVQSGSRGWAGVQARSKPVVCRFRVPGAPGEGGEGRTPKEGETHLTAQGPGCPRLLTVCYEPFE